jgi:hypothetical protein
MDGTVGVGLGVRAGAGVEAVVGVEAGTGLGVVIIVGLGVTEDFGVGEGSVHAVRAEIVVTIATNMNKDFAELNLFPIFAYLFKFKPTTAKHKTLTYQSDIREEEIS